LAQAILGSIINSSTIFASPASSPSTPQLSKMGCGGSKPKAGEPATATDLPLEATAGPEATVEEKATAQLWVLFASIDMNCDKTVDKTELQKAMQNNPKFGELIKEANLDPEKQVLEQLDTNKDGRVTWDEFKEHLKKAATEQVENQGCVVAAEASVAQTAETRLKQVFDSVDTNKDGHVNKEELFVKLNAEDEGFKQLLTRAGLNTEFSVLEQIDGNQDGRVTWQEFYDKLGNAATKEVEAQGDLVAATEIKIEDEATSKSLCC